MISVIIITYNTENYIESCLKSVLKQPLDNFEIIVVDDGSADKTYELCQQLFKENENELLARGISHSLLTEENSGPSAARNLGLKNAVGDYVCFIDGDDRLLPGGLELLEKKAATAPDADIVIGSYEAFENENEGRAYTFYPREMTVTKIKEKTELFLQLCDYKYGQPCDNPPTAIGVPWGRLYKRAFLQKNNLYFLPQLRRMQDNIFNMQAFAAAEKIIYFTESVYAYRLSHISSFRKSFAGDYYSAYLKCRYDFMQERPEIFEEAVYIAACRERDYCLMNIIKNAAENLPMKKALPLIKAAFLNPVYAYNDRASQGYRPSFKHRFIKRLGKMRLYRAVFILARIICFSFSKEQGLHH